MEVLGAIFGLFLYDLIVGKGLRRWRRNLLAGLMAGLVWSSTDFEWWGDILAAIPLLMMAELTVKKERAERT